MDRERKKEKYSKLWIEREREIKKRGRFQNIEKERREIKKGKKTPKNHIDGWVRELKKRTLSGNVEKDGYEERKRK